MLLPDTRPFLSASQYLSAITNSDPKHFDSALWDAQQALAYLPPKDQSHLRTAILTLGNELDSTFHSTWLAHAYYLGSAEAVVSIQSFLKKRQPKAELVALANQYLQLLATEHTASKDARGGNSFQSPRACPDFSTVRELLEQLSKEPPSGFAPAVATDCDGTTWGGDIGELLFETAIDQGRLLPAALPALQKLLRTYEIESKNEPNADANSLVEYFQSGRLHERGDAKGKSARQVTLDYYQCNAWALAGHHVGTVKAWTQALFNAPGGLAQTLFPGVIQILRDAEAVGFLTLAISASSIWSVEAAATFLKLPIRHCRGIATEVSDQIISSKLKSPVPYGKGKLAAIQSICGGLPLLALGDSFEKTDKEMLEKAGFGAVIQPANLETLNRLRSIAPPHWFVIKPYTAEINIL